MKRGPVLVVGGPLDGNKYDLPGDVGGTIELNSAAGVCVYELALAEDGTKIASYLGPAGLAPEEATQGPEFSRKERS